MSFRCDSCNKQFPSGHTPKRVVTAIRWRAEPSAEERHARPELADAHPSRWQGWEIAKEVSVCPACERATPSAVPQPTEPDLVMFDEPLVLRA